jgi:hypothetical protein
MGQDVMAACGLLIYRSLIHSLLVSLLLLLLHGRALLRCCIELCQTSTMCVACASGVTVCCALMALPKVSGAQGCSSEQLLVGGPTLCTHLTAKL